MKKIIALSLIAAISLTSCVSKKKYTELEQQQKDTSAALQKTKLEKEELEAKFAKINSRVEEYNAKINSLNKLGEDLQKENDVKLDVVDNMVISNATRRKMNETLAKLDPALLANAKTLKDSMNVAISHNLKKSMDTSKLNDSEDVNIKVDNTVVMISVSDNLLFNTASYRVNRKSYELLKQVADVVKSEPSLEVMIEGHTDSRTINNAVVQDNWDLSVKRATSIVRLLEKKYGVPANKLIASGRGSSVPLVENNSNANRAKNRRTRIVILPNLDKFLSLLSEKEDIKE